LRQLFDFGRDQVGGVFGAVGIRRKDNRQRLADIANMIFGKDRLPVRLKAFNPRQAEIDWRDIGDVRCRPNSDDAWGRAPFGDIDCNNAAVGVRRADHAHVQLMRKRNIGRKTPPAHDQGAVLKPQDRAADEGSVAGHAA
jgi:hypothetical protein